MIHRKWIFLQPFLSAYGLLLRKSRRLPASGQQRKLLFLRSQPEAYSNILQALMSRVAVQADMTDLCCRDHLERTVYHTQSCTQDRNNGHFTSFDLFYCCAADRSLDLHICQLQMSGCFIADHHCDFADRLSEILCTRFAFCGSNRSCAGSGDDPLPLPLTFSLSSFVLCSQHHTIILLLLQSY